MMFRRSKLDSTKVKTALTYISVLWNRCMTSRTKAIKIMLWSWPVLWVLAAPRMYRHRLFLFHTENCLRGMRTCLVYIFKRKS